MSIAVLVVASSLLQPGEPPTGHVNPKWIPPVVHSLTLLTVVRTSAAFVWPDPFAQTDPGIWGKGYEDAFTHWPVFDPGERAFSWDHDRWEVNLVGHALMGSELYLRARNCEFGWAGALAFAAGGSMVWEYGFEANAVRPSAQDLVYTPVAGMLLGEGRFQLWRALGGLQVPALRLILRSAVDPFGEYERRVGLFGC